MENNIDRLFQEGLSADKIENLSLYSTEKPQWKLVRSKLHAGKKRWFLMRLLPLLLLVGAGGGMFYVSYSARDGALTLASEQKMTSTSVEEEASMVKVQDVKNDFESEVKIEQEDAIAQAFHGEEVPDNQAFQTGESIVAEKNVKSTESYDVIESNRPENKQAEYRSTENTEVNAKEEVVMTNKSSVEAAPYASNENQMASSDSPYSYGSATNHYGEKLKETAASYDYRSAKDSSEIDLADDKERPHYFYKEIASMEIARLVYKPKLKWSIEPEVLYHERLSLWKSLQRGFNLRIGIDGPVHFNHSEVIRSGFGYNLGTDVDLTDRWGISADYIYQKLDRDLTGNLSSYNLPFKSDLYQELDLIESTYKYTSHTLIIGIRYTFYNGNRLQVGLNPGFEISGRGKALGEFTYEGPYQQEKENFEFESNLISANSLSLGIIAEYKLFARVNLVVRIRRQVPVGTGEDWKLYNRAFVGLSYKI
ncbi:porin family protein [Saprospiraceae bacterium]|nr:porin family protein [Saprospiraceae bacterium]